MNALGFFRNGIARGIIVCVCAYLSLLVSSCEVPRTPDEPWVVRDSAGIVIVENDPRGASPREVPAWRTSAAPILQLGSVEGPAALQFHQVQHAALLDDGRIAISDGATAQVRIFGRTGEYLYAVGGRGEGPGEFFASPSGIGGRHGDSLVVFHNTFVSIFGPRTEFVRRFMLASEDGLAVRPLGRLSDGSVIGFAYTPTTVRVDGDRQQDIQLLRYDLEGRLLGIVGQFLDQSTPDGDQRYPFGYRGRVAVGDSTVWYAWSERFELREFDREGRQIRIVRLKQTAEPLTDAEIERYETARRENAGATPSDLLERILGTYIYVATRPALNQILVDDRGNVWVHEFELPFVSERRPWHVFDSEGRYVGVVDLPEGFELFQVRDDVMLGRWTDELGVEHVQLFALERSTG